jgi:hypothetical protein
MPDFGSFRGFGEKLVQGQTPTQLGLIGRQDFGIDPDGVAFNARVVAAGGTLSANEQLAIDTLVKALKDANIWDGMKAIYPMVGASAAACAQNLKSSSFTGVFNGSFTYASTGVKGSSAGYMDTNLNPSLELTTTNSCIFTYNRTASTTNGLAGQSVSGYRYEIFDIAGDRYVSIGAQVNCGAPWLGWTLASRQSATQYKIFKNNTNTFTNTTSITGTFQNSNMMLNRVDFYYGNAEFAFFGLGAGLTDTQSADFYTAVQAFQTTLGRQV